MSTQKHIACTLCASRKLSPISDLPEKSVCSISTSKNLISHRKGQMLYYEGTKPLGIFCINSGVVKVYKTASNGKDQIIHLAKAGDFLGYAALLGEENYSNSAMILEDAKVCFIPKEVFFQTLLENTPFFRRIAKELSRDLQVVEEKLTDSTQKSVRERLAFTLLVLANNFAPEGEQAKKIDLLLTREEISSIVGTATESVIRLLSEFKKDGLIELDGKKIIIKDHQALARLSDFYS